MQRSFLLVALTVAGLLLAAGPADAHHSWQLDRSKLLTLSGTVTRVDFANPHVQVYLQVEEENGSSDTWQAGGPSPNQLSRGGWTRDTVKPGDQITVAGYRNRDGSRILRFDTLTLASGQVLNGYRGRNRRR
jgi:Family of unknown function (DUF6152)